ncbi:hypothetical protein S245_048492 [Arachis hypogaea]
MAICAMFRLPIHHSQISSKDEAEDLNLDDFDFNLANIFSKARQVYSSKGTRVSSSSGQEPEVASSVKETEKIILTREEEVTSPKPQLPRGPSPLIVERVNIVLDCLNHPLEDINNNAYLKA